MSEEASQKELVNVIEIPHDKMDAVIEALRPVLGDVDVAGGGPGTGCSRTSAYGSEDWSCSDTWA